jgi:hypothetical protein
MQITLNEEEIKDAIDAYVRNQISVATSQRVSVDLKAGRGENGFTAILDIRPNTVAETASPPTKPISGFRSTTAPVEDAKDPSQEAAKPRGLKIGTKGKPASVPVEEPLTSEEPAAEPEPEPEADNATAEADDAEELAEEASEEAGPARNPFAGDTAYAEAEEDSDEVADETPEEAPEPTAEVSSIFGAPKPRKPIFAIGK